MVWRNLSLYLLSRFCTASATMMLRAAIAWHVFALTHSAFHLGLIGLVQFLPIPTLMLVGGVLADRYDRRRIMLAAQAVPLASATTLFFATRDGWVSLPLLYSMVLASAISWAFDSPARAALLPTLVPRPQFPRAVTLAATTQALAFTTGPALSGLIIAEAGIAPVYGVYVGLVLVALVGLVLVRIPRGTSGLTAISLRAIGEGLSFVWRNQVVFGCMLLDMLAVVFGGATALLPIYASDILHVGARGYGLLTSSLELGALCMSFVLTMLPPVRRAGRVLLATVVLYGLATIVFGLSRSFPLSIAAYMLVGMADQVSVVMRGTAIQLATPDPIRGRVSSVNMIFIGASNQLGAAESGFLAAATSPTFAVVFGGIASVVVAAVVAVAMPRLRRYRTDTVPLESAA